MQIAEPEQLEIQLGAGWAGVEFQLKTDAGLYPGVIPVAEDGILRLEIGGSTSYVLSCMNSSVSAPKTENVQVLATASVPIIRDEEIGSAEDTETERITIQPAEYEIAGIPVLHLVLFGGGMILAIGGLLTMWIVSRRHRQYDDEDDLDDDY